jgi:outer membrane protein insertion porin family
VRVLTAALLLTLFAGAVAEARAQDAEEEALPLVERVEITGNQYVSRETFLHYVSTKPGDRFDVVRLRGDFQRLWDTGFVEDVVLHADDGPAGGKVVRFVVAERKRVQIVDYRGSKALTTSHIEDELKKRDAAVRLDTFYDLGKARRVESVIRQMLVDKGRPFATVRHEAKPVGAAALQVSFVVDDGPRARVSDIVFTGNQVFSDARLRRAMKVKRRGFRNLTWLLGKTTWTADKWSDPVEGDRKRVEELYLSHGYVTAALGEPVLRYVDVATGKKPVKGLRVEIPVTEGDRYRVGTLGFEAMTVLREDAVRPLFKLKTGDVYDESRIRKGLDKLREAYGSLGYFQWTARTDRKPDAAKKLVDVTLVMEEDKRYFVGRIDFTGNLSTRDKVIRRELYLSEGDVFNTEALKLSIRRLNQLGYFKPLEGAPELKQSDRGEEFLDVTLKVEEQNRNQFTFGGGVSGLEGAFLNASFQTSNFLGLGETFSIGAQTGSRSNNYQIAITEPYLFDRPITAGIDLFSRKIDYVASDNALGFSEVRTGASFTSGLPLRRFTRLMGNYTYEVIDTAVRDDLLNSQEATNAGSPLFGLVNSEGRNQESRVTPSFVHNTVDNPFVPRRGNRITGSLAFAGGPLGGTVNYLRRDLEAVLYIPHLKRTALGLRGEVGWITPFGRTEELPYYQRFFLGGETQIRGVNARTVSPVDANRRALGGNKFLLVNAEYYFDMGPLRALAFFDAGEAYTEGQSLNWRTLRTSMGGELRFLMPVLNVPFRLISAYNANRDAFQPKTVFKFAVGTTF